MTENRTPQVKPIAEPSGEVPVSAIMTAHRRIEQTLASIAKIRACKPGPDEILVHVDGNETECVAALRKEFPDLKIIVSEETIGPGGGRNKLVGAARNEFVASFDDDSYPVDSDFFERAVLLIERLPAAALIGCSIFHRHEPLSKAQQTAAASGSFVGCGVVYRRSAFLDAGGYVPLAVAYGMEEEDLSLRLLDRGMLLLNSPWLRVFHDTDLSHHSDNKITAAQIANTALLAFLRYPKRYWPYGAAQMLNRVLWSIRNGRTRGIAGGLIQIPAHLWRHRKLRSPVTPQTLRKKWELQKLHSRNLENEQRASSRLLARSLPR